MVSKALVFAIILAIAQVAIAADYSMDISGIKTDDYSIGEKMKLRVSVLEGEQLATGRVNLLFSDALGKKKIRKVVDANSEFELTIGDDFPSGLWSIKASYNGEEIKRNFVVSENSDVEFRLEGDELVIKNTGNVRYTRTIQIKIGDKTNSYVQNIGVGEEKRLKLISPKGSYDIEVTDGKKTLSRKNVELFGTGNVIGAVDKDLVGYTGFAGAGDLRGIDDKEVSLSKLPISLIFIAGVMVLGILVAIERKLTRKAKGKGKKR